MASLSVLASVLCALACGALALGDESCPAGSACLREEDDSISALQFSRSAFQLEADAGSQVPSSPCPDGAYCPVYDEGQCDVGGDVCSNNDCDPSSDITWPGESGETCKVECPDEEDDPTCYGFAESDPDYEWICVEPPAGKCVTGWCTKSGSKCLGGVCSLNPDQVQAADKVCFPVCPLTPNQGISHFTVNFGPCPTTTSPSTTSPSTTSPSTTSSATTSSATTSPSTTSPSTTSPSTTSSATTSSATTSSATTSPATTSPVSTTPSTLTTTGPVTTTTSCKSRCDYCEELCAGFRCSLSKHKCLLTCASRWPKVQCSMDKYCKDCCEDGACPTPAALAQVTEGTGADDAEPELGAALAQQAGSDEGAEESTGSHYCKSPMFYCQDFCMAFFPDVGMLAQCKVVCMKNYDQFQAIVGGYCAKGVCAKGEDSPYQKLMR